MYESNIRGEIPLFAAIRSGNVPLCDFLIQSWPESGKKVLQATSDSDNVSSWEPAILSLCLRGAVGNFVDLERGLTDEHSRSIIEKILKRSAATVFAYQPFREGSRNTTHQEAPSTPERLPIDSNSLMPRSKSPVLESVACGKKRSSSGDSNRTKKQRFGYIHEKGGDETFTLSSVRMSSDKSTFRQVHAALECSATTNMLECVLQRYPEQHSVPDDYGRLPLHIAISHCRSNGSVDFILEKIWKPHQDACFVRDSFGRLPLHLALMTRADSRLVRVLLDAYPSSGVEPCQVVDERYTHMMPIHMATSKGCDLSTLFMLIRQDPTVVGTWKKEI